MWPDNKLNERSRIALEHDEKTGLFNFFYAKEHFMNSKGNFLVIIALAVLMAATVIAYPPAVGILGQSKNCLSCHVDNGKWIDGPDLIIDIVDKTSGKSLIQTDSGFLLSVKRGQSATLLTVIGYRTNDEQLTPYRNAWLYVDSDRIKTSSLSKFPPGWEVNLPMACRLVGDKLDSYAGVQGTVLPMTIRPTDAAGDGLVSLQVMLTKGEAVKGKPKEGMLGNYFERALNLKVEE